MRISEESKKDNWELFGVVSVIAIVLVAGKLATGSWIGMFAIAAVLLGGN